MSDGEAEEAVDAFIDREVKRRWLPFWLASVKGLVGVG